MGNVDGRFVMLAMVMVVVELLCMLKLAGSDKNDSHSG